MTARIASSTAFVVACICSASVRMSTDLGLPVVLIDATQDVPAFLARLNRVRHGALVRAAGGTADRVFERGWDDWDLLQIEADGVEASAAAGVGVSAGRIVLKLPTGTTLAEYRAELRGALRHLSLRRVLDARDGPLPEGFASASRPRYARARASDASVRVLTVDDLYVVDPMDDGDAARLFWLAVSARLAATAGGTSAWR